MPFINVTENYGLKGPVDTRTAVKAVTDRCSVSTNEAMFAELVLQLHDAGVLSDGDVLALLNKGFGRWEVFIPAEG